MMFRFLAWVPEWTVGPFTEIGKTRRIDLMRKPKIQFKI